MSKKSTDIDNDIAFIDTIIKALKQNALRQIPAAAAVAELFKAKAQLLNTQMGLVGMEEMKRLMDEEKDETEKMQQEKE